MVARESGVKARAVRALRGLGYWTKRMPVGPFSDSGMPDVLTLLRLPPGRAMWLEFKEPGNTLSRLQEATINELRRGGAVVAVVETVEEAVSAVKSAESKWARNFRRI